MFGPDPRTVAGRLARLVGDEPPYHAPVFVLTHHAREPIEMAGGTTFHFVTDGFDSALRQARTSWGTAWSTSPVAPRPCARRWSSGALDELVIDLVPVVLGRGESMFADVTDVDLTQIEVAHSPHATHIRYRVASRPPARP